MSSIATDSVISHSSSEAGTACRVSARSTRSTKSTSRSCITDRFTATGIDSPCVRHWAICRQASSRIQSPRRTIMPKRSASPMNCIGPIRPSSGWFQRTSASTPLSEPSRPSIFGW